MPRIIHVRGLTCTIIGEGSSLGWCTRGTVQRCGVCGEAAQVCVVDGRCMARVAVSPAPAACTFRGALPGCAAHVVHLVPRHSARAARQPALAAPLIHLMLLSTIRRHALCARHVCSAASHAQCGHPASRCQRAQHPGGQRRTVRAGRPGPGDTTQAGATGWQCGWQCSTLDTPVTAYTLVSGCAPSATTATTYPPSHTTPHTRRLAADRRARALDEP